jgi:hypothetical protein
MHIPPHHFSRCVLAALAEAERDRRLRELEALVNQDLQNQRNLLDFQKKLYAVIEQLSSLGYDLGRWEYDCEIEIWGDKSYMDPTVVDELLLRSEFPRGVRLAWGDYEALVKSTP